LKTKIAIFKIFFIPFPTSTYVRNPAYNFVDFRTKRAGTSNYGGRLFFAPQPNGRKKVFGWKRFVILSEAKNLNVSEQ
jgi:hypothetical protein